jgi:RNA polymerase sigma factor (sigma-70 family)
MAKDLPTNMKDATHLTQLANDAQRDPKAAEEFFSKVYEVIREIARNQVGRRNGTAEGPTEVANEVAADFIDSAKPFVYHDRGHVMAGLVTRIRHKISDLRKARRRIRRGGEATHEPLDSPAAIAAPSRGRDPLDAAADREDLDRLRESLTSLQAKHPNAFEVLKLRNERRTVEAIANKLDVSPKTVVRWNQFATAFLYRDLRAGDDTRRAGQRTMPGASHDKPDR